LVDGGAYAKRGGSDGVTRTSTRQARSTATIPKHRAVKRGVGKQTKLRLRVCQIQRSVDRATSGRVPQLRPGRLAAALKLRLASPWHYAEIQKVRQRGHVRNSSRCC